MSNDFNNSQYYEILEVNNTATREEINASFRLLAKEYHPDRVPDHLMKLKLEAKKRFIKIREAYGVLKDEKSRNLYDAYIYELNKQGIYKTGGYQSDNYQRPSDTKEKERRINDESVTEEEEKDKKESSYSIRSSYKFLSMQDVKEIPHFSIRHEEKDLLYGYSTINHDYEVKEINGNKVVVDHTTGLMWHQGGSDEYMTWGKAKQWVVDLNKIRYAGYNDWRLPTVEEAVSLLDCIRNAYLHIDNAFSPKQDWIWTGDKCSSAGAWIVYLDNGRVRWYDLSLSRILCKPQITHFHSFTKMNR